MGDKVLNMTDYMIRRLKFRMIDLECRIDDMLANVRDSDLTRQLGMVDETVECPRQTFKLIHGGGHQKNKEEVSCNERCPSEKIYNNQKQQHRPMRGGLI